MRDHKIGRAPDYTVAALVMLGVNLVWILVAIWAIWGFVTAVVIGLIFNHGITVLSRRSH